MKSLAEIKKECSLPVQSHLSENLKEIEWVKELHPTKENYAAVYDSFGLFETGAPAIMAHCVWSNEEEMDLLLKKEVYIAHCPQSNTNLSSGIAPVRRFLDKGLLVGLGSDVSGGANTSIFRAMTDAIQVSKLRNVLLSKEEKALTLEEAFYMGTRGGGSFFGKPFNKKGVEFGESGSFDKGWDFDALVIDDTSPGKPERQDIRDRLERVIYLSNDKNIKQKYVRGKQILS